MESRDRAVGALVGLAVGDAVGTTLEFERPGSFAPIDDMVGGGPFALKAGQWTDDTSMAMCLAESIIDTGELDPADQLRRYVAWWRHGHWSSTGRCFDIGATTSAALRRFETTGAVVDNPVDQESAANGSLMRLAPVPIRWHADVEEAARRSGESSRTTHGADRPVDACRVYGAMIAALIRGATLDEVLDPGFWRFGTLHPAVEAVARGSWRQKEPPSIRGSGYVVDALEAALWAVGGAVDFRDAVLRAANLGDDADTTAAIAGQLAGAWWGYGGIPERWRWQITAGERIAAMAGRLYDLGAGNGAGVGPRGEWVVDQYVHGYWIEPGRVLAGEYPGNSFSEETARDRVNALVDHGIRTFVDLTSPADGMVLYERHLTAAAERRGLSLQRIAYPIPDMGTIDLDGYRKIVATIDDATSRGGVYFHCWGGIGRTGTVAGCLLVESGLTGHEALTRIRELRSVTRKARVSAPQAEDQVQAILAYGAAARR